MRDPNRIILRPGRPVASSPVEPIQAPAVAVASIPVMITRQMEADLRASGYSERTIRSLTPEQAWILLGSSR